MGKTSPTQRTLQALRKPGCYAQVVERWIPDPRAPGGGRRIDLFGWIDLVAIEEGKAGVLGIQACAGPSVSARLAKLERVPAEPKKLAAWERMRAALRLWLETGNRLEVWAWRKVGPRGKRKLWEVRVVVVDLGRLGEV